MKKPRGFAGRGQQSPRCYASGSGCGDVPGFRCNAKSPRDWRALGLLSYCDGAASTSRDGLTCAIAVQLGGIVALRIP